MKKNSKPISKEKKKGIETFYRVCPVCKCRMRRMKRQIKGNELKSFWKCTSCNHEVDISKAHKLEWDIES